MVIWAYVGIAATITFGIFVAADYRAIGFSTRAGAFAAGAFIAAVVSVFAGLLLSVVVGEALYEPEDVTYDFDVVTAKDGSNVQGQFSIFGGYIEEVPYYFFYRENPDGGIYQGKIRANNTLIYEDQESRSFITVNKTVDHWGFWGVALGGDKDYEIHVPKGSVDREIEFDLE